MMCMGFGASTHLAICSNQPPISYSRVNHFMRCICVWVIRSPAGPGCRPACGYALVIGIVGFSFFQPIFYCPSNSSFRFALLTYTSAMPVGDGAARSAKFNHGSFAFPSTWHRQTDRRTCSTHWLLYRMLFLPWWYLQNHTFVCLPSAISLI